MEADVNVDDTPKELKIGVLVDQWDKRAVRPNLEYQRGSAWTLRQQQLLIDSIFRGYPLPKFYFLRNVDTDVFNNKVTTLDVIDGQQRLIALSEFINDKWPLFDVKDGKIPIPPAIRREEVRWSGKTFSGLPDDLRSWFENQELTVVFIQTDTNDEVRDLFIRLQSGTPLSPQQVRDAWPGNLGPFVERLAGKGTRQGSFQGALSVVDRRGSGRRNDDEFADPSLRSRQTCAQLLLLHLAKSSGRGYPRITSAALNDLYHEYTDFDIRGRSARTFEEILEDVQAVVDGRPDTSSKKKVTQSNLFSLFLFLRYIRFNRDINIQRAVSAISKAFWADYDGSEEPRGRATSADNIEQHLGWFIGTRMSAVEFPELDHRRLFSEGQKVRILSAADGVCQICGERFDASDLIEYDHVKPWILGGPTIESNGRAVHARCHKRGRAAIDEGEVPTGFPA